MSRDSVAELPPAPATNDLPLNKQIGKDLSTPNKDGNQNNRDCEKNPNSESCLPKFQIVDNLPNLQKIEDRQKQLEPLTNDILKSREKALKNRSLRESGQIPESAPSDTPSSTQSNKPSDTNPVKPTDIAPAKPQSKPVENQPEVYDASGLNIARQRAKDEGKKLFIEVYGETCGGCIQQDGTMRDAEVQNALKNAIFVKINGDRNPAMLREFGVTHYPTNMFYSPGQNQPYRHVGPMSKQMLLDGLR
jgi:thiol-disulfide isomerase/thioredoxin